MKRKLKKELAKNGQSFANQRRNILTNQSNFLVQESYKTLRTNIRFFLSNNACKKFCITSCNASEGKSITILNLAISFAQTGQRVLLIDGDMRRPSLAKLLIEKPSPGLSNVLAGLNTEAEVIRRNVHPNLDVIVSGEIPPNPSELLGNENMQKLLDRMSKHYDFASISRGHRAAHLSKLNRERNPLCRVAPRGKVNSKKARSMAECYIGRPLQKGEIVHHMNGKASDNSPQNLLVMTDKQHRQLHMALAMEQLEGGDDDE